MSSNKYKVCQFSSNKCLNRIAWTPTTASTSQSQPGRAVITDNTQRIRTACSESHICVECNSNFSSNITLIIEWVGKAERRPCFWADFASYNYDNRRIRPDLGLLLRACRTQAKYQRPLHDPLRPPAAFIVFIIFVENKFLNSTIDPTIWFWLLFLIFSNLLIWAGVTILRYLSDSVWSYSSNETASSLVLPCICHSMNWHAARAVFIQTSLRNYIIIIIIVKL